MNKWKSIYIRNFRKGHKLSQGELGKLLGVTPNYIHLLEKGVKTPSKTLQLLLDCVEQKLT